MPIPAIAGVSWLAGLLGGLVVKVVEWGSSWVSKRLVAVAATAAGFAAATVVFNAAIQAAMSGLNSALPPYFEQACSLVVPSNYSQCMAAIITAHLARWVYVWTIKGVESSASAK